MAKTEALVTGRTSRVIFWYPKIVNNDRLTTGGNDEASLAVDGSDDPVVQVGGILYGQLEELGLSC
jgi:hypothetical protein